MPCIADFCQKRFLEVALTQYKNVPDKKTTASIGILSKANESRHTESKCAPSIRICRTAGAKSEAPHDFFCNGEIADEAF